MSADPTRRALADALERSEDALLTCVHCGFCLPACPTYVRLGDEADSPRGRLHLMRAVAEGRLPTDSPALARHLDRCLGCRACEPVCPSGVPYGHLLERGRAVVSATRPPPAPVRALLAVVARPVMSRVVMALGRLARASGLATLARALFPRALAFPAAMLEASAPVRLTSLAGAPGAPAPAWEPPIAGVRVGVLKGCVQDGLFGRVNRATERTLEANGYRIVPVAGQSCCGALHAHAGDLEGARELALRNLEAFEAAGVDRVCVNAAGCGAALRDVGELLADTPEAERARAFSARIADVSELLALAGPRRGGPVEARVAYDPPCHLLHGQGVADPPLAVLDAVPGLERVPVSRAAECCGGAGVYGMTHPELGGGIGRDKCAALREPRPDLVATGNPGCAMQIGAVSRLEGAPLRVVHPVELLDESYRRAGFYEEGR